jgi:DNA-binding NtrC family response regulator
MKPEQAEDLTVHDQLEFEQMLSTPAETMQAMAAHAWPGNVRELRNVIERAMILSRGEVLEVELPSTSPPAADADDAEVTLEEAERRHIQRVLAMTAGRVRGRGGAAEILGLHPATLDSRMQRLGIRRPPGRSEA